MNSILPIISISELQRRPKAVLESIKDYAVIQSHGRDRAFVLSPLLGRVLLQSGMLELLQKKCAEGEVATLVPSSDVPPGMAQELTDLLGNVLRELSKK